ncbi:MAG: phage head-tail joining protein [Burkholderiaceae bacterium]
MSVTQADLDNLAQVMRSGELRVQSNGRMVEYRSMADLESAYNRMKAEFDAQNAIPGTNAGGLRFVSFDLATKRGF